MMDVLKSDTPFTLRDLRGAWNRSWQKCIEKIGEENLTWECREALYNTIDYIPQPLESSSYSVEQTWKLCPRSSDGNNLDFIHSVLRPINIIQVKVTNPNDDIPFHRVIANGFDMYHCRVVLGILENSFFSFDMDDFTRRCIAEKKIVLTPRSFQGTSVDVAICSQLLRVHKYLRRDFKW